MTQNHIELRCALTALHFHRWIFVFVTFSFSHHHAETMFYSRKQMLDSHIFHLKHSHSWILFSILRICNLDPWASPYDHVNFWYRWSGACCLYFLSLTLTLSASFVAIGILSFRKDMSSGHWSLQLQSFGYIVFASHKGLLRFCSFRLLMFCSFFINKLCLRYSMGYNGFKRKKRWYEESQTPYLPTEKRDTSIMWFYTCVIFAVTTKIKEQRSTNIRRRNEWARKNLLYR